MHRGGYPVSAPPLGRMGARIAAMAHHSNDGNHAGTNLPTPFNALSFRFTIVSLSPPPLSFLSFSLCQPLALVARFSADTSPRYAALRRHDTSAFADPTTLSAFSTRPQPSHSRFIQRYPPSSVRPFGFVHLSDHVFASVSRLTHFTTHFARCKTMMNTDDRTGTWHRDTQTKPTGRGSSLTRFVLSGFSSYRENRESCLHPFENSFEEIEEDPKNHFLRNVNQQSSYSSKFNSPLS